MSYAFFYKSVNGDRVYDDTSFEHWLKKFFTSGVFLNDLQVKANNDMTVSVGTGYVNADGKVKIFEAETTLQIETAGATYPRIDSIVLERNDTERDIVLKVVKGGYSSEPVAHVPVRQDGVYQLVIAQILVNAGAVKVTQADITDTRSNTELCGFVASTVEQIDFSQVQTQFDAYFAQYKEQIAKDYTQYNSNMDAYLDQMENDFALWFENIRNQLDEDAAGHLQNQIDDINERLEFAGGSSVEVTVDTGEYNATGLAVNLEIDGKTYTEIIPSEKVVKFTGILEVGKAVIKCVDEAQNINTITSIDIRYYGAYECSVVLKGIASYEEWITAGGLNPSSYENLDALLEDEEAVKTLITKKEAVDVLVRIEGEDLETIINHRYVAKWVNDDDYAYNTLSAVSEIKDIMDASGMYGMYITTKSNSEPLVPVFTSNTDSEGRKVTASSEYSTEFASYNAFNDSSKGWKPTGGSAVNSSFVRYNDIEPICVNAVKIQYLGTSSYTVTFKLQGSNDGSVWDDLATGLTCKSGNVETYDFDNEKAYKYYKFIITNHSGSILTSGDGYKFQLYGYKEGDTLWEAKGLVPVMTSNNEPDGEVLANSALSNAYYVFDEDSTNGWIPASNATNTYLAYRFEKQAIIKKYSVAFDKINSPSDAVIEFKASNNGIDWVTLDAFTTSVGETERAVGNNAPYLYYGIHSAEALAQEGDGNWELKALQFYGRFYSPESSDKGNALTSEDVVDNLLSESTDLPLSANQGRLLNERIESQESITVIMSGTAYSLIKKGKECILNLNGIQIKSLIALELGDYLPTDAQAPVYIKTSSNYVLFGRVVVNKGGISGEFVKDINSSEITQFSSDHLHYVVGQVLWFLD